jgi:hypothetical protein
MLKVRYLSAELKCMPSAAMNATGVDFFRPLAEIAPALVVLVMNGDNN